MPYIDKQIRYKMDAVVQNMMDNTVEPNGKLNYVLFKLCKEIVWPSYNNYKNYIGELEECIAEIRRSILGPYEEEAKKRNGDI